MLNRSSTILSTGELCLPRGCAFELIGRKDVVHDVPIEVFNDRFLVNISGKQLGMDGVDSAITTDVEIVAVLCGNHAKVLTLSLCTLSNTSRNSGLHLVRASYALVSILYTNGEANRILDAIAAPGRTNAGLDGTKSLAVGVATLQTGLA